jgi:hypothetical protein
MHHHQTRLQQQHEKLAQRRAVKPPRAVLLNPPLSLPPTTRSAQGAQRQCQQLVQGRFVLLLLLLQSW